MARATIPSAPLTEEAGEQEEEAPSQILGLAAAAPTSNVPSLSRLCETTLMQTASPRGALQLLYTADAIGAHTLSAFCIELLASNLRLVCRKDLWAHLPPNLLKRLRAALQRLGGQEAEASEGDPIQPSDRLPSASASNTATLSPSLSPTLGPSSNAPPGVRARQLRKKLKQIDELERRASSTSSGGGAAAGGGGGGSTPVLSGLSEAERRKVAAKDLLLNELETLISLHPELEGGGGASGNNTPTVTPELTPSLPPLMSGDALGVPLLDGMGSSAASSTITTPAVDDAKRLSTAAEASLLNAAVSSTSEAAGPSGVSMLGGGKSKAAAAAIASAPASASTLLTSRSAPSKPATSDEGFAPSDLAEAVARSLADCSTTSKPTTAAGKASKKKSKWRPIDAPAAPPPAAAVVDDEKKAAEEAAKKAEACKGATPSTQPASIPGWGWVPARAPSNTTSGVATAAEVKQLSLSEIQQEEERIRQQQVQQQRMPPTPPRPTITTAVTQQLHHGGDQCGAPSSSAIPIMQFVRCAPNTNAIASAAPASTPPVSPSLTPAWGGKASSVSPVSPPLRMIQQQQQQRKPQQAVSSSVRPPVTTPTTAEAPRGRWAVAAATSPMAPTRLLQSASEEESPTPFSLDGEGPTRACSILDFVNSGSSSKKGRSKEQQQQQPPASPRAAWGASSSTPTTPATPSSSGGKATMQSAASPAASPPTSTKPARSNPPVSLASIFAQQAAEEERKAEERAMLLAASPGGGSGTWGIKKPIDGSSQGSQRWGLLPEMRLHSIGQIQLEEEDQRLAEALHQQSVQQQQLEEPPAEAEKPSGRAAQQHRRRGDRKKAAAPTVAPHKPEEVAPPAPKLSPQQALGRLLAEKANKAKNKKSGGAR